MLQTTSGVIMASKTTLKTKLLSEYKNTCWAIGYWQRRFDLATTPEQQKYCSEGLQRNEKLKPGLELALSLAGIQISITDWHDAMVEGVTHVNEIYGQ